MKIFKFMTLALVAMLGFSSCSEDCNHNFIEHDHSADLVGTWTCIREDFAEALVIKADGSVVSTGAVFGEEYWEDVKGKIVVENGNVTMTFEDGDNFKGHFDIIPGMAFSISNDEGRRFTYDYCANDLADEIVGMWVCNDVPAEGEGEMMIETFYENGKSVLTGFLPLEDGSELVKNNETDYNVVGDLLFVTIPDDKLGGAQSKYIVQKLIYSPNGTSAGDIMTLKAVVKVGDQVVEGKSSWLRIKQSLDLTGKTYDYSTAYVTSAKGKDEDFTIMGNTFNIAKIKAYDFDKMFSANLFCVELNANSFNYKLRLDNGQYTGFDTPMTIDGNKVTLDMSAINPALRKVEMHMFQDANDTQVHFYMHTDAFINYFANMEVYTLIMEGKINPADSTAVAKVFADMEARVESINVSFVMKARK